MCCHSISLEAHQTYIFISMPQIKKLQCDYHIICIYKCVQVNQTKCQIDFSIYQMSSIDFLIALIHELFAYCSFFLISLSFSLLSHSRLHFKWNMWRLSILHFHIIDKLRYSNSMQLKGFKKNALFCILISVLSL